MSIAIESLSKRFGAQVIVDDVSLEIADGELFVLLGSSGSGKSTLLRLIAGLSAPDHGRIVIGGRDVTRLPPQARGTGFVFQNYSLFRHMTVGQNVEFGLRLRNVAPADRLARREALLGLVDLAGLDDRRPDQLSGGQRQRVALARALAYSPNVLLLDEPFGALDAKIRAQLRRSLRAVQAELDVTTILVTHDQEEAFELADRIGILDRGRLVEVGAPEELYARPRTLFAATFLGAGAVLVGQAAAGEARLGDIALPLPAEPSLADGAAVQLLIRPEHVVLFDPPPGGRTVDPGDPDPGAAERPASAHGPVLGQGTVIESTFTGAQRRVRVRLPRPARSRQLAPRPSFGETGILIDAVLSADAPPPSGRPWVAVTAWHVLAADAPRLLWCPGPAAEPPALVGALARGLGAHVRVLGIAPVNARRSDIRPRLEALVSALGVVDAMSVVRRGDVGDAIAAEQAAADAELTIVPWSLAAKRAADGGLEDWLRDLLIRTAGPVLVVRGDAPSHGRILVCTAGGEPGKGDVAVGRRLAAALGAAVTLLYVDVPARPVGPTTLGHLERAAAAVADRGIPCEVRVRKADTAAAGIAEEARAGGPDLVVMGGPGPRAARQGRSTITEQVIAGCGVSVVVVPDQSGR